MKLSTRSIYSLRLMIYLADHVDRGTPINLKEISRAQNLPFKYLEQLVISLKNAGLIKSVQGKQGGYVLARNAQDIRALDVVEASMGPIELMGCTNVDCQCDFKEICTSRRMWGLIRANITDILNEYSLVDLSEKRLIEKMKEQSGDEDISIRCEKMT